MSNKTGRFQVRSATPHGLLNGDLVGWVGQDLCEDLQRRVPVQRGPRAGVEAVGDGIEFLLGVDGQVGAFGQVLAQQTVGVFADTALPGTVGVAEVHAHAGGGGEFSMTAHPAPLVIGHGLAQRATKDCSFAVKAARADAALASGSLASRRHGSCARPARPRPTCCRRP